MQTAATPPTGTVWNSVPPCKYQNSAFKGKYQFVRRQLGHTYTHQIESTFSGYYSFLVFPSLPRVTACLQPSVGRLLYASVHSFENLITN